MMKLYILRHGKDIDGYRGGWSKFGLSDEGVTQAIQVSNYILRVNKELRLKRIISSDLNRALQTAKIITSQLGIEVEPSTKWRETNNGELAGMPNDLANEKYSGLYYRSLKMDERYPGGESPQENYDRIRLAYKELLKEMKISNENVLLVTHGGVINIIYYLVNGMYWTNTSEVYKSDYTSLHCIDIDKNTFSIENFTDYEINL